MAPGPALKLIAVIFVAIAGFIAICLALKLYDMWPAFLFLTYWGAVEKLDFDKLQAAIIGAFAGLALALTFHLLPTMYGTEGGVAVLGVVLTMLYLHLTGRLLVAFNVSCFFFLTVGTIGQIQRDASFADLFANLAVGVVYFAGGFGLVRKIRGDGQAAEAPAHPN